MYQAVTRFGTSDKMSTLRLQIAPRLIGLSFLFDFVFLINAERYSVTNLEVNNVNRVFWSTDVENTIQCARKCHATNCTSFTYGEKLVDGTEDCYETTPALYSGRQSRTISGEICQRWDAQTPHDHSYNESSEFPDLSVTAAQNFCRDPDNSKGPWCYTMNPDVRWQYCPVRTCNIDFKNERCYHDSLTPKHYNGTWSLTRSGKVCQRWDAQSPNSHSYTSASGFPDDSISAAENYCRDPNNSGYTWCYTVEPGTKWEACDVTSCTKYINDMKCYDTDSSFQYSGKWDLVGNNVSCQRWDSQTPHEHTYTDPVLFPDDTVADAGNYCRDPDGLGYLWCYTSDPSLRWASCGIRKCLPNEVTCYDGPSVKSYMGTWNTTKSGKVCQRWDSQHPHPHKLTEVMFNEDSLEDAENFCRDPTDTGELWCYTIDPSTVKEKCGIGKCSGEKTCQIFSDETMYGGSGQSEYYTKDP